MPKLNFQPKCPVNEGASKPGLSKTVGFLLGIPFSWPGPPIYIFAFACFFFLLIRNPQTLIISDSKKKFGIYLLIFLAIISNMVALSSIDLDFTRVITTILFFLLFTFDEAIDDKRELLDGYTKAMYIWAVFVFLFAIHQKIYEYGLLLFSIPEYRLWGSEFFPDWPNYLAFMLSVAFMLNVFVFGRPVAATVQMAAALLTTSRTPFLALGLCTLAFLFAMRNERAYKKWLLVGCILLFIFLLFFSSSDLNKDFLDRMLIFEDRDEIYRFAINLAFESPVFGNGSVLLDESIGFMGFPSFHNSYLDIFVRHGALALILFVLILVPNKINRTIGGIAFAATILFFLIGSTFQNFLKHPHIVMIYVVCANAGYLFHKKYET